MSDKRKIKKWIQRLQMCMAALVCALMLCFCFTTTVKAASVHTVTFMYGTKVIAEVVPHGGTAMTPVDTAVPGFMFAGWTDTAANIKSDKIIIGTYIPLSALIPAPVPVVQQPVPVVQQPVPVVQQPVPVINPVPVVQAPPVNVVPWAEAYSGTKINNNKSAPFPDWWVNLNLPKGTPGVTCAVHWYNGYTGEYWKTDIIPYGASCPLPKDPCIDGYQFVGWEGDWTNVTEDRAIKSWYFRSYTITFRNGVTDKVMDRQTVRNGDDAKTPRDPSMDGYSFIGWDGDFSNVHSDRTIYANFRQN